MQELADLDVFIICISLTHGVHKFRLQQLLVWASHKYYLDDIWSILFHPNINISHKYIESEGKTNSCIAR
jgi:hypothetical protein